jgi:ATP-binding protein involved in chromosome partitioning
MPEPTDPLIDAVRDALTHVLDPEIKRPITDLGMVRSVEVAGSRATVGIDLTTPGCPLKDTLTRDVSAAASSVDGIDDVSVVFGVMSADQRAALRTLLRGTDAEPVIPFAQPG